LRTPAIVFDFVPRTLAQEAPTESTLTLLDYIRFGGPLGYVLIGLSVAAVALMIAHLVQARLSVLAPAAVVEGLTRLLRAGDVQGTIAFCRQEENDSFIARVIGTGLTRASRSAMGMLELRTSIEDAGRREVDRLTRVTDGIGLIAAVGPMLGLLGTVFGMIGAFGSISALEGAARSRELAGFMSMALVNTAEGLAVAIPCTVAFAIFRRRIDRLAGEVGDVVEGLIGFLEPARPGATATRPPLQRPPAAAPAPGVPGATAGRGAVLP